MPFDKKNMSQTPQSDASKKKKQYHVQGNNQNVTIDLDSLSLQERTRLDTAVIMLVDYILSVNKEKVV